MTLKSEKSFLGFACIYILIMFLAVLLSAVQGMLWIGVIIGTPCIVFLIRFIISVGRTITLSDHGCVVKFGTITRVYSWSQFVVRRIDSSYRYARLPLMFRLPTYEEGGVFLCTKNHAKPFGLNSVVFSTFYCPWSSVYVSFIKKEECSTFFNLEGIYEAEKELFLEKMQVWGVSLESCEEIQ